MPLQSSGIQTRQKRRKANIPYGFGDFASRHANNCPQCQQNLKIHPEMWTKYNQLSEYFQDKFPISETSPAEDIGKALLGLFNYKKAKKDVYPEIIQTVFIPVINDHHKHTDYNLLQPPSLSENNLPESSTANEQAPYFAPVNTALSPMDEWFKGMPETEKETMFLNKWFSDLSLEKKRLLFQSANCQECTVQNENCLHNHGFDNQDLDLMRSLSSVLDPELQHQ